MTLNFNFRKEKKITTHHQKCDYCHKEIQKGKIKVSYVRGCYNNNFNYGQLHKKCFIEGLKNELEANENNKS